MRLDVYITNKGHAKSRETAQRLIKEGNVKVDGRVLKKVSEQVDENAEHTVEVTNELIYVSRGGLKLECALDKFSVNVEGLDAVDIGASTGGFTDCLLKRGIASVRCVDVGRSQLDQSIAADCRVRSYEGMNARYLTPCDIGGMCDLAVCDVSFISLTHIIPAVRGILRDDGRFISLIKPQFEAGRKALDKHGIVRDRNEHIRVIENVIDFAAENKLLCAGLVASPIEGGDGNREYLALFDKDGGFMRDGIKNIVFGHTI